MATSVRPVKGVVRVRCRMPLKLVLSDVVQLADGRLAKHGLMCMPRRSWMRRCESRDPAWIVADWGPWVVAYRVET